MRRTLSGTMQLSWVARSSRPLPSASRRRAGHNHFATPFSGWILPPRLFGETPNRATETVALPFSDCVVPAKRNDAVESAPHLDPLPAPSGERRAGTDLSLFPVRRPGHGANEGSPIPF